MTAAPAAVRILIVIPAYREEKSIGAVVSSVRAKYPYDMLVVYDGSPRRHFLGHPPVRITVPYS